MFSSKKPFSAVTVGIDNFTGDDHAIDDLSGLPELVEVIKLQATGPREAARAIRKKLKYGNVNTQLRALTLLDGLIQNAGDRFRREVADEMLLERLRVCGTAELSDNEVKAKCKELFRSWASQYKGVRGLEQISTLYKQLPQRKQAVTQERSKAVRETDNPFDGDEDNEGDKSSQQAYRPEPTAHGSSGVSNSLFSSGTASQIKKASRKEKDNKISKKTTKAFNLEKEKPQMKECIATSLTESTNLMNTLRSINREQEQISHNQTAVREFEACKQLRRRVLRYIENCMDRPEFLGVLLECNQNLVTALMSFEQLDRAIDADSDSEDEMAVQAHAYNMSSAKGKETETAHQLSGLNIGQGSNSPKQQQAPVPAPRYVEASKEPEIDAEEDDENDPFGDSNAVETPAIEKGEPDWGSRGR